MASYRTLSLSIDAETGRLINSNGDRITREEFLPRLMLVDKVRIYCEFFRIAEENGVKQLTPSPLPAGAVTRIIGDSDHNLTTPVMFAADGTLNTVSANRLAFVISSDNLRFAEALNNQKSRKCEFVITMVVPDESSFVVLAKDFFIAENRPIESVDLDPSPINPTLSEQQIRALMAGKSDNGHQHVIADLVDLPDLSVSWSDVSDKPVIFPPASHTHLLADLSNLAELSVTVAWDDVTARPSVFSPAAHTHKVADLTDYTPGVTVLAWDDVTGKPESYPASIHRHQATEIDNLPSTDLTSYTGSIALSANYNSAVCNVLSITDTLRDLTLGSNTLKTFVRGNQIEVITNGSAFKVTTNGSTSTIEFVTNDIKLNTAGLNSPGGLLKLDADGNIPSAIGGGSGSGSPGKSAYQIWLDQGNTGSEADFLASLKGAKGDQGAAGASGVPGTPGSNGTIMVDTSATQPSVLPDGTIWIGEV